MRDHSGIGKDAKTGPATRGPLIWSSWMLVGLLLLSWALPAWAGDGSVGLLDQLGQGLADWLDGILGLFGGDSDGMGFEIEPNGMGFEIEPNG